MQTEARNCSRSLEPGQLWRLEHGYVYIVELGKRLIHYKMLRNPNQRAAVTQLISIEALLRFLTQSEAVLDCGQSSLALCCNNATPNRQYTRIDPR